MSDTPSSEPPDTPNLCQKEVSAPEVGPSPPKPLGSNYFAKHWRGDFTLAFAFWGNGVLLGLIFKIVFAGTYQATTYLDLRLAAAILLACLAITIAFKIWQAIGIWRSAEKHPFRGGTPALGIAARALLVLLALSFVTKFGENMILQIA